MFIFQSICFLTLSAQRNGTDFPPFRDTRDEMSYTGLIETPTVCYAVWTDDSKHPKSAS